MPLQECDVSFDQQVAQFLPCENVEPILSVLRNLDESYDEPADGARLQFANDLTFAVEGDVAVLCYVAELPGRSTARFDLNRDVPSGFVGGDNVVMRHIASEGGSDQPAAGEFRRD